MIEDTESFVPLEITKRECIRLGLFLPQYSTTGDSDFIPIGAGVVGYKLIDTLAKELKIEMQIVGHSSPPKAIEALNAGACDVLIMGIEESRRIFVNFTPAVIQFDYAYLVPPGSPINEMSEVDRSGHRIAVPGGHASWIALKKLILDADIVDTEVPDEAFALVRDGDAEVYALPREQLLHYKEMLPGSRILTQGFGINDVGFAVAKGEPQFLKFMTKIVQEAKRSGLVKKILIDAVLISRGFDVAK